MKGLEIADVAIGKVRLNGDFRVDPEFFVKLPRENPKLTYVPIGTILTKAQYGLSIDMNEDGVGFPIYRMNEIADMICIEDIAKHAALASPDALPFVLRTGDVLFNRTNSQEFVGRTGLFKAFGPEERVFASYLIRLVPDSQKILPEYLTTFLNTQYGVADVKRRARMSINQSNVNAEELKAVRIPLLSMEFQPSIAEAFEEAHSCIRTAKSSQLQTEQTLLSALGLKDWQPPEPLTYTRRATDVFTARRFDAEHFQPRYLAMLDQVQRHAKRCRTVEEFSEHCDRGAQPEYFDDGPLAVITSKHILETGLDYEGFDRTRAEYWDNAEFVSSRIHTNDILTYTTGAKVGRTACYLAEERALASNHVNLLRVKCENPLYVAGVMNSMIGRWQTRMLVSGSAQVELYSTDIRRFIIPFVDEKTQTSIADSVRYSYAARRRAHALLERAKRAVEVAIEDSEAAALKLLAAQIE